MALRSTLALAACAASVHADLCTPITGHDCVGSDLVNYTSVASPGACCALCEAYGSGCTVWKWNSNDPTCYLKNGCTDIVNCPSCVTGVAPPVPPAPKVVTFSCSAGAALPGDIRPTLTVYNDSTYDVSTGQAGVPTWFTGGDIAFTTHAAWYGVAVGSLRTLAQAASNGSDAFGSFTSLDATIVSVGGPSPGITATATFACYDSGFIAFNLSLPQGLSNTTSSKGPVIQFPSFESDNTPLGEDLGWLVNGGIWTIFELWGVGTSHGFASTDGPTWLYNTTYAPSTTAPAGAPNAPTTAILAPLTHFKASKTQYISDPNNAGGPNRLVIGPLGSAQSVPAGYVSSSSLWASSFGVNAATFSWGAAMQAAYGTVRIPKSRDVLNEKLSFWSDNGAVYFQSWWDSSCNRHCNASYNAETQFLALKQHHESLGLPYAIYQLDTWWFTQGSDVGFAGSLDCAEWAPRPDLWPNGLLPVTQAGVPLILYSWGYIPTDKGNRMTNFTWLNNADDSEGMVALDEMYSFYSMIRDRFLTFNGTSFEQDNMGSYSSAWTQVTNAIDGAERWWAGFATPWCESGIPVQICEATASDVMESLKYNCITSTRDNIDDVPGTHQSPSGNDPNFLKRWHVGFDRMLISALGLHPFFDNVWSTPVMPESTWGDAPENYTELAMALSVLGSGAVGIGDMIGYSNVSLIMTTAAADGTLLTPSRSSTYIDAVYLPDGSQPFPVAQGRVFQAPSFIPSDGTGAGTRTWMTVLSIDVGTSFTLMPSHTWPDLSAAAPNTNGEYAVVNWSPGFAAIAAACASGAPASDCVTTFNNSNGLSMYTGVPPLTYIHNFELWSLSPMFSSGYALLGELNKFVRVSPARIAWCNSTSDASGPSMVFQAMGTAGESINMTVITPGSTPLVAVVPITFTATGTAVVTCTGEDAAASCAVAAAVTSTVAHA